MREVVAEKSSSIICLPSKELEKLFSSIPEKNGNEKKYRKGAANSLFAFPGQCNFSGAKIPLSWVDMTQAGKLNRGSLFSNNDFFKLFWGDLKCILHVI